MGQKLKMKKKLAKAKKAKKTKKNKKNQEGRKTKQSTATAVEGNCNNITCLNDMLEVLKIDKDMVQNFIQQKKRLDSRLSLAGKKGGKSGDLNETIGYLKKSFGGDRALERNSPICAGRYNSTKANDGAKLLVNISKCEGKIQEACNISLSNDTSSGFDTCFGIMMDYRVKVNITKEQFPLNCSNWRHVSLQQERARTTKIRHFPT